MGIDLASIGSFMSGAGDIASAFSGGDAEPRGAWAKKNVRGTVKGAVESAKKYGFHPLWLLGAPGIGGAGGPTGVGVTGSGIGDALSSAGNALQSFSARKKEEERLARVTDAQVDQARAAATADRAQAQKDIVESQATWNSIMGVGRNVNAQPTMSNPEELQKYVRGLNPFSGKAEWFPNPKIFEMPEWIGAMMYGRATIEDLKKILTAPLPGTGPRERIERAERKVRRSRGGQMSRNR